MTPAAVLQAVRNAGGEITIAPDGRLRLTTPMPLPEPIIRAAKAAKPELLTILADDTQKPRPLPPALQLPGRRLWKVRAPGGSPTPEATTLVGEARKARVVLVADGAALSIIACDKSPADGIVRRLANMAPDVLAVLHRESDRRMGRDGDAA